MWRRSLKVRAYFTFRIPFRSVSRTAASAQHSKYTQPLKSADGRARHMHSTTNLTCAVSKKLPAVGRGARLSVSPVDDESDVIRTVHGWPNYTLFLICARVCEVRHWGEIAGQFDSPVIIGRLTIIIIIIIIIVLYINRRLSLTSSWLSTKTFAIVDTRYDRLSAQP